MSKPEVLWPVTNAYRNHLDLSGYWWFAFDAKKEYSYETGVPRERRIPVPASWAEVHTNPKEAYYVGTAWYETMVFVPKVWMGDDVFLRCEGIAYSAVIYVNGQEAGRVDTVYAPQVLTLTRLLRYGEENRLVIKVNNELTMRKLPFGTSLGRTLRGNKPAQPQSLLGGIVGGISLYTTPQTRVVNASVHTVEFSPDMAKVHYQVNVQGNTLVTVMLRDREGRVLATHVGGQGILEVPHPHLWSIGDGYLYSVDFEVSRLGKQHDTYRLPVGIRHVVMQGGQCFLNGTPITLRGVRLDVSRVQSMVDFEHYVEELLAKGYNCLYVGDYVLHTSWLQVADQKGILVMAQLPLGGLDGKELEFPEGDFQTGALQKRWGSMVLPVIEKVMQSYGKHPSIIGWVATQDMPHLQKEHSQFYKSLLSYMRTMTHGIVGLSVVMPPTHVDGTIVEDFDCIWYSRASQLWHEEVAYIDACLYQDVIDWNIKNPGKGVVITLGKPRAAVDNRRDAFYYDTLTAMLASMKDVQGIIYEAPLLEREN